MEAQTIYNIIGVVIFSIIVFFTLRKKKPDISTYEIRPTENKKIEIINEYKKRLSDELKVLDGNKEAIKNKKTELLKEFNTELSLNIYFDQDEIREILFDLSR